MRAGTTRRMSYSDAVAQGSKLAAGEVYRSGMRVNSHVLSRRRATAARNAGMLALARSIMGVDR